MTAAEQTELALLAARELLAREALAGLNEPALSLHLCALRLCDEAAMLHRLAGEEDRAGELIRYQQQRFQEPDRRHR